jgi:hypothetical protein
MARYALVSMGSDENAADAAVDAIRRQHQPAAKQD